MIPSGKSKIQEKWKNKASNKYAGEHCPNKMVIVLYYDIFRAIKVQDNGSIYEVNKRG